MGLILLRTILLPLLMLAVTIGLTLAIEFPIIYFSGITKNKKYIVAVNALTNVCLNAGIILLFVFTMFKAGGWRKYTVPVWTILCEVVLIPVTEAMLYTKVSDQTRKKIWILAYAANICSYVIGGLIFSVVFKGVDGLDESLMRFLFGGL